MSYIIRRVLAKPRLILDEMCRLYGKFESYLRRVLCKTRLIFPRINGPIILEPRTGYDGLASHPGGIKIFPVTSSYRKRVNVWPNEKN